MAAKKGVLIDVTRESLHQATGTTDKMLGSHLLIQAVKASGHGALSRSEQFEKLRAIVSQLEAVAPTDSLEGMLAVQLVSIHNMAMALLANATARTVERGSAASQASQDLADLRMGRAMKLIAQFQRGLEALDRRRGKDRKSVV